MVFINISKYFTLKLSLTQNKVSKVQIKLQVKVKHIGMLEILRELMKLFLVSQTDIKITIGHLRFTGP